MKYSSISTAFVAVFGFFALFLPAQSPTGNIVGRVMDPSGAVVADAKISVRHTEGLDSREVVSNASGEYTVASLPPGHYQMVVEKQGFKRLDERGLELQVAQTARLDFQLQVGAMAEVVEVTASVPLLNTDSPMKGDVVAAREMVDIPLDGRDFTDLAALVPGVENKAEGGQGSGFAVNGARADNTNFIIDGFNDRNPRAGQPQASPPIDAMREFKVQTTGYSAEYGRLAGGTINMVLKSGTNRLHGSVFDFIRNEVLDARDFFDPKKTPLRRNQFGTVLDGPVTIPKIYNGRDRTFFLFTWEGYRQINYPNALDIVPTELERRGDFSQTLVNGQHVALLDPAASGTCAGSKLACFPNTQIPAARIDPIAKQIGAYYPLPNRAGVNNFYTAVSAPHYWDNYLGKVDHRIGSADTFSVRFLKLIDRTYDPFNDSNTGLFPAHGHLGAMLAGVNYNRIFRATLINEFRAGMSRTRRKSIHDQQGHDFPAEWGLKNFSTTDPFLVGFPTIKVTNMVNLGNAKSTPGVFTVNIFEWADTVTWVKGRHMVKFGGTIQRNQFFQPFYNNNRGIFNFNGRSTGVASPNLTYAAPAYAVPFGDFLLGMAASAKRTVGVNPNYLFRTDYGFFAQDDFKATHSLTFNLGLRYELPMPPVEKYGRLSNFVPGLGKLVLADNKTIPDYDKTLASQGMTGLVVLARDIGFPGSLVFPAYHCFAPRFGFAWRPFGGQTTVIRGGYGIYYGGSSWNPIRNDLGNVFPFSIAQSFSKVTFQNPTGATPSVDGVLTPSGFQSHPTPQYLQGWNLTVERELGKESAVEIAYIGSKGTHLIHAYNINMPYRLAQYQPNFPRPYKAFNDINYYGFGFNSIYSAGTITIRKRFARGVFYRVNYVYAKSIDNASQLTTAGTGGMDVQNPRGLNYERARSDWDRGHSFTTMFIYDFPFQRSRLLRGWQIGGTGKMATGQPFTPQISGANLDLGEANRPDRLRKGTLDNPTPDRWFDLAAFQPVPATSFRFGSSGRNILDGPGLISLNFSLIRRFRLGERGNIQFRVETFNALNHPNFKLPNVMINAPAGGTITNVGGPALDAAFATVSVLIPAGFLPVG